MLYAGAVAAGVFASAHHVSVFGAKIGFGAKAFVVMALAGTLGYLVGSIIGWWIGLRGGRPLLERRGRWLHVTPDQSRPRRALVRALGELRRARRPPHAGRPLVRLDPGRRLRDALRALHRADPRSARRSGPSRSPAPATGWARATSASTTTSATPSTPSWQAFSLLAAYLIYRLRKAATVKRRDDPAR